MSPFLRASVGLHTGAAALCVGAPSLWPWALGAVAANQVVLTGAGMWPRSTLLGANLHRLPPTGREEVALTFDDGPHPAITPSVLDILERHGARGTFFCVGARARAHPDLVRAIAARGHAVENHTDRHPNSFACLPPAALRREIAAAQDTLGTLTGQAPRFLRAPMGLRSPLLDPLLDGLGLRLVSWTRRALDGVRCRPEAARARLLRGLAGGDILLLHDWRPRGPREGMPVVLSVLPAVLGECARRGLRCVTLGEGIGL